MEFMNSFISTSTKSVVEEAEQLVQEQSIKEKVMEESRKYSNLIFRSIQNDDENAEELPQFKGIEFDPNSNDYLIFHLVLDFFESTGMKFAPSVFRHESQNPMELSKRFEIAETLKLRSFDKTPLLVQLIEEARLGMQNS